MFRKNHYRFVKVMLFVLITNFIILLFIKPVYLILSNPKKHFAYDYHIAKEVAQKLKAKNISKILCRDYKLQKRLKYYGITIGNDLYLTNIKVKSSDKFSIKYMNKEIEKFYIIKI